MLLVPVFVHRAVGVDKRSLTVLLRFPLYVRGPVPLVRPYGGQLALH